MENVEFLEGEKKENLPIKSEIVKANKKEDDDINKMKSDLDFLSMMVGIDLETR